MRRGLPPERWGSFEPGCGFAPGNMWKERTRWGGRAKRWSVATIIRVGRALYWIVTLELTALIVRDSEPSYTDHVFNS